MLYTSNCVFGKREQNYMNNKQKIWPKNMIYTYSGIVMLLSHTLILFYRSFHVIHIDQTVTGIFPFHKKYSFGMITVIYIIPDHGMTHSLAVF